MPAYKYSFQAPVYQELVIQDESDKKVGTLRIKPSTILWKPGDGKQFYSVTVDAFEAWITSKETRAKRTKQ